MLASPSEAMNHVECKTCGATLTMDDHHRSTVCPYCASPTVVERPARGDVTPPTFALGFAIPREDATQRVRDWARRGLFRHSGLSAAAIEDLRGIYVPTWLYSAVAEAPYSASIGEEYTVTKTRTVMRDGKMVTETYTEVETEWRSLQGNYVGYVADVLVTASRALTNDELTALEPFDLRALARYAPALVSGWLAEDVSLAAAESRAHAVEEARSLLGARLSAFMPGDKHTDLRYHTSLTAESADVLLVPVWVLAMRHAPDAPPIRVLMNGQTGKIHGKKPLSVWKIVLAVTLVLALTGACVLFAWGRS